nr:immunoglobulin heavy chain junction region [Mus musculus]
CARLDGYNFVMDYW